LRIVDQVCEKIKPHLTPEFQTGRFGVNDFRDILKRIEFTKKERQYISANFRFVVTKLGLFHYLPEIQGNEDVALYQLVEVVTESWIASGAVKNRSEAINKIVTQIKERTQIQASSMVTVSEAGDLRIMMESLRENIANFWKRAPERIPDFIDQFRDNLAETSQSSRLLYDIAQFNRKIRSKEIKHLEDVMWEIDSWEKRLHLDR
jgi:gas vesicle protein